MQTIIKPVGTFDHARSVDQMQAIDLILRHYFQTWDWLRARNLARWKRQVW
jgi:hypothetical protein